MFIGVWIYILVFDLIPLVNLSVFMLTSSWFHSWSSVVELEVRNGDVSESCFIVQNCFGHPLSFVCPYEVVLSRFVNNYVGILIWLFLGELTFLLCWSYLSTWKFFHFLISSLISFFQGLKFLWYRSFMSLVSVTTNILLCVSLVKGHIFLISFSGYLSFVYRRSTDFL